MSKNTKKSRPMNELCDNCGVETPHDVAIKIVEEGKGSINVEYSREPYRISVCNLCGEREILRMNDGGRR